MKKHELKKLVTEAAKLHRPFNCKRKPGVLRQIDSVAQALKQLQDKG